MLYVYCLIEIISDVCLYVVESSAYVMTPVT